MKELLPIYVLYKLAKSGKNPNSKSQKDLINFLEKNSNDPDALQAAEDFDSNGESLTKDPAFVEYINDLQNNQIQSEKMGGKIEYLKSLQKPIINVDFFKKGGKVKRKCACGCNLLAFKEKGGKMVERCACGCKTGVKKDEKGAKIELNRFSKPGEKPTAADTISKYNRVHPEEDTKPTSKMDVLKSARKEFKGKKVDVKKEKGGELKYIKKMQKLNLKKK